MDKTFKQMYTEKKKILAYHGSPVAIKKFDNKFSSQGVFWFSVDKEEILGGSSGASSVKYLITVELTVNKTAGWDLYDKLSLDEIEQQGYDSILLDDDWVIFDTKNIKITDTTKVKGK